MESQHSSFLYPKTMVEIDKKVHQLSQPAVGMFFTIALDKMNLELEKAGSCLEEMMKMFMDLEEKENPDDPIKEAVAKSEKVGRDTWQIFKDKIKGESALSFPAFQLEFVLDKAKREFEIEVKIAVDEYFYEMEVDASAKGRYEGVVNRAVEKYVERASSAFLIFEAVLRQLVQRMKQKVNAEKSLPDLAQKPVSKSALKVKLVKVMNTAEGIKISAVDQEAENMEEEFISDLEEMEEVEEGMQNENLEKTALEQEDKMMEEVPEGKLEKSGENMMSNEGKGIGQRLDYLEVTMSNILKTMKEMNERLISVQKKQEDYDNDQKRRSPWSFWDNK